MYHHNPLFAIIQISFKTLHKCDMIISQQLIELNKLMWNIWGVIDIRSTQEVTFDDIKDNVVQQ